MGDRQIAARLRIYRPDDITPVDLTDYLTRARVSLGDVSSVGTGSSGTDVGVRQLDIELINSRPDMNSLNPRDQDSSWNQFDGTYQPLLWPERAVEFDMAVVPIGQQPAESDYVRLFAGYLGDSISASSDNGRISIQCRDAAQILQNCYIETVREYGTDAGEPAEVVIQQIIDYNLGPGVVTLYTPVSPNYPLTTFEVDYQSVWDAIQRIAGQRGWFLGYRWDSEAHTFRLTFMEPPRTKDASTADFSLDWNENLRVQSLDIKSADVRNVVKVTYRDKTSGKRNTVTVEDADSIAAFGGGKVGRRAMEIEEADASHINSEGLALEMAHSALHDLKDLTTTSRITMPLTPAMDVFTGVTVVNPRLSSTVDFYAVESVEHAMEWSSGGFKASTEIVCSGRVIGGHGKWLRLQTRPGAAGNPVRPVDSPTQRIPAPPGGLALSSVFRGLVVTLDERLNDPYWDGYEIHVSTTSGYTPGPSTLKAKGKATRFEVLNLTANTTYYVKAIAYDTSGNASPESTEVSGAVNDDLSTGKYKWSFNAIKDALDLIYTG